ncbi:hypothetical protein F5146DRAFT_1137436 [Armillaria mellea]|nr:hypothetical protein F5146DRAFT_1137436 [Armillaria mellea]
MLVDFPTFLTQLNDALVAENGLNLAYLLRPTSPHGKDLVKQFRNPTPRRRPMEAFKEHTQLVSLFFRFFTENRGWTLPALFSILRDLRDLAFDADSFAKYNNLKSESMEEAARVIAKAFGNCMTDRTSPLNESRKWGVYYVVGLILKCYFRASHLLLIKVPLLHDPNSDIPPLQLYPRSHQVTYRYYIGMLSFLNEDYAKSEEELTLAFYQCHTRAQSNQERILTYLLPLRILKGHLPSQELMDRFPTLKELYHPFLTAIRTGDVSGYDRALDHHEKTLLDLNLWITLEKARELCLRGLFRRVWVASQKGSRVPISMFYSSLKISDIDVEEEEAECLVANMIYKGFMKGYISHEKRMVVLSNTNAFPKLAERSNPYGST